jgi:phage terminase small subunit
MAKVCKKLTDQQWKFAEEWLIHGNGTLAVKTAYPDKFKTDGSAAAHASRLLKSVKVSAYIEKRRTQMAAKFEITPERTLRAYARRAYFDPRKLLDPETGNLIPLHRLPRDVAAAVTEIHVKHLRTKTDEEGNEIQSELVRVKWDNGDSARDAISKYIGLYEKDNAQRGQVDQEARQEFMKDLFQTISQANGRGLPEPRE